MKWPARSPDLKPIENTWSSLARAVYRNCRQFDTVTDLECCVVAEWKNLSLNLFSKLIGSMQKRCIDFYDWKRKKVAIKLHDPLLFTLKTLFFAKTS